MIVPRCYLPLSPDGNCRLPCVGSHLTLVELPSMLVFNSLFMHLVFPNRILVTWAVEVDEVPFIRNFQNRMISSQRLFADRRKLQVAVAAWSHFLLYNDAVRRKRCVIASHRTDEKQSRENWSYDFHAHPIHPASS